MTVEQKLQQVLLALPAMSLTDALEYLLLAGAVWLFFDVVFHNAFRHRRASRGWPTTPQIRREILHSLRTLLIFVLVGAFMIYAKLSGWTRVYWHVGEYGWPWFAASVVVMVVLHDAYFYWTHRLMHHRLLFRAVHQTHHLSTSPTPWAAYAFSAPEALVQAGIGPLIVFTVPTHPVAFLLFMIWQVGFNVFGHCGYEIFPRAFMRCGAGKVLNSVTHHALHHEKFRANYSLYFNVWDRLLGTNHPEYEQRFLEVTAGPAGRLADDPAPPPEPAADLAGWVAGEARRRAGLV